MNTKEMSLKELNRDLVKKIRVGIFLFPPLLKRFRDLEIPYPGGCNLGKRPVDDHIRGFEAFGYQYLGDSEFLKFSGETNEKNITLSGGFAVTATENMIMTAAFRK